MAKPEPQKIDPASAQERALKMVKAVRFPMLATIDGSSPRVRPVSPVRTEGFTVYIANLKAYHKTAEIEVNPNVELCYLDDEHNQVRISGTAEVVTDEALKREIWNDNRLLQHYLGSVDNPQLIIYKIVPRQVRFMLEWALDYHDVPVG